MSSYTVGYLTSNLFSDYYNLMIDPELSGGEPFSAEELTPRQLAEALPEVMRRIVGRYAGCSGDATDGFIITGTDKYLAIQGILSRRSYADLRQEAWDNADWKEVDVIDRSADGLGDLADLYESSWTDFGMAVARVCHELSPPNTYEFKELIVRLDEFTVSLPE